MSARPIIAVDVDEVVADLLSAWLRRYNAEFHDNLTPDKIDRWEVEECVKPEAQRRMHEYLRENIYDDVEPFPEALFAVERLREIGRVVFVSACVEGTIDAKYSWLKKHGFVSHISDFINCKDKSLIAADVLLDDGIHNVEMFPRDAFLIQRPHNVGHECSRERIPGYGLGCAPAVLYNRLTNRSA